MLSDAPKNTAPGTVARGAWFGLWAQAVDKVLPVVLLLYLARTLEPAAFGVYSFLVAYLALFQVVSDYSLDTVLVRTLSQQGERAVSVLRAGLGLKLAMALLSAVVASSLAGLASGGHAPFSLAVLASLVLPTALGGVYRAWFRAKLDIRAVMYIACLRAFLLATGVMGAVAVGAGLHGIFAATAAANLLTFVGVSLVLRRTAAPSLRFDAGLWKLLLSGAWPLMLNALAMTVSLRAGHIILMSVRGPVEVGLLGAAARVTEAFQLVPEALMISVYPIMADAFSRGSDTLLGTAQRAARYLVAIVGYPVVLCSVAGGPIMELLFGSGFRAAGDILAVSAFLALFGATGTVIVNLLVSVHREKALYRVTMVFAAVNIGACLLLIPTWGAIGAAAAMLVTSAASQLVFAVLPESRPWVAPTLIAGARAAVVIPAAIAASLPFGSGLAAVAAATAVYGAGLLTLGVFDRREREFLLSMWHATRRSAS